MRLPRGRLPWVLLATALATSAPCSRASAQDPSVAAELKARGDRAFEAGRPADALDAYVEAYRLSKDPALLYNKGRALQALTEYPRALEQLEAFEREAPPDLKQRVPGLSRILDEVRGKVTRLTVHCPAGAVVRLRDRTVGTCPLSEPVGVNAGRATLEVTLEGHERWSRAVELPGAGVASFDVALTPARDAGPPLLSRWWFWAGLGAVAAGGVAITVALTTERDPRGGSVPPGVVSAGLHGAGFRF